MARLEQAGERAIVRQVGNDRNRHAPRLANAVRHPLKLAFPAGGQHHLGALGRQHRRQPRTDPPDAPVTSATRSANTAIDGPPLKILAAHYSGSSKAPAAAHPETQATIGYSLITELKRHQVAHHPGSEQDGQLMSRGRRAAIRPSADRNG